MAIEQIIKTDTTAPTALIPASSVIPSSPASVTAFVDAAEGAFNSITVSTVPNINTVATQLNTFATEANALAVEVNGNAVLAENYATLTGSMVEAGTYSSKEFAIGDLTTSGGSAKAWATDTASPDGTTTKSAKTWAEESANYATIALNSSNYKGDWVSGYVTTGYSQGMSVSYTDGFKYVSKIDNNLVEPITKTNTAQWDFLEAVSPAELDLKFDKSGGSLAGAINTAKATVISSATTSDIWTALGNIIDWTGTATTTEFPSAPQAGATRTLVCAGDCSFTAGVNMLIDGVISGATVTCTAGDTVIVRAMSTTQFKLTRIKADGTAQVSLRSGLSSMQVFTTSGTWTKPDGIAKIKVTVVGGGGGGGRNNGYLECGSGGAGSGASIKLIDVTSISNVTVTVGAGGGGGASAGTNGTTGGTSSFGAYCSVAGGGGGRHDYVADSIGASPSIGVGGNINLTGGKGMIMYRGGYAAGGSIFGQSFAFPLPSAAGNAQPALGYGVGGAGTIDGGLAGSGSQGIVIVEEYV